MNTISITKHIELTYSIKGYDHYCFGKDKKLYNTRTGKVLKRTLNCCTEGYWIGRKFKSLHQIKPLLTKIDNFKCPF